MIDGKPFPFLKETTLALHEYVRDDAAPHSDNESRAPWREHRKAVPENKVMPGVSQINSMRSLGTKASNWAVVYPNWRDGTSSASSPKRVLQVGPACQVPKSSFD
jgi:hypothetical protein